MEILHREFLKSDTLTCHASTIAFYKDKPVFSWFGGAREGLADSCIFLQSDQVFKLSNTFPALNPMTQTNHFPCWNPILFEIQDHLYLFFKVGTYCDRWQTMYLDISKVWDDKFNVPSDYKWLNAGLNFCVKTKPIIHNGFVYCGSSVETFFDWSAFVEAYIYDNNDFVFAYRSEPLSINHKTVNRALNGYLNITKGLIQPTLWQDQEQRFNVLLRSDSPDKKIYHSIIANNNIMWSIPKPINTLNNPNSSIDVVFYEKNLYLVYNPVSNGRIPLVIDKLDDQFKTLDRLVISDQQDLTKEAITPEFSYPYMIEKDGKLHLTYTWGRKKIEYCIINIG